MTLRPVVLGWGEALPRTVVDNYFFAQSLDTSHEWIESRSGICQRHWVQEDETTSTLAIQAARQALDISGLSAQSIDAIVVATTTPDHVFPSVATMVQHALGARGFAFDIQAACTGFVYALSVANSLIVSQQARVVLVIGADCMSRIVDPQDRSTAVLFGDGAGALLLSSQVDKMEEEKTSPSEGAALPRGILSTHLFSDGSYKDLLYVEGGPGSPQRTGFLKMVGKEVFKLAVRRLGEAVMAALDSHGLTPQEVDWFVPHQANIRIMKTLCEHFAIPFEKMIVTIDRHGNTSAASIPLALVHGVKEGRIQPGHLIVLEGMGGGLTWGSVLLRW